LIIIIFILYRIYKKNTKCNFYKILDVIIHIERNQKIYMIQQMIKNQYKNITINFIHNKNKNSKHNYVKTILKIHFVNMEKNVDLHMD
jgi:hypothetical protein